MSDARRHLAIAPAPLGGAEARTLIARLNAELTERYPNAADRHFGLTEEQVTGGSGVFLVATLDGEPVGCGALRRLDDSYPVARARTAPSMSTRGAGTAPRGSSTL